MVDCDGAGSGGLELLYALRQREMKLSTCFRESAFSENWSWKQYSSFKAFISGTPLNGLLDYSFVSIYFKTV